MQWLKVEKGMLEEFKMLLQIPKTRQYLEHARDKCKIEFARYIKEYIQSKKKGGIKTGSRRQGTRDMDQNDPGLLPYAGSNLFQFNLNFKNGDWLPFIEVGNSGFEIQDLMPEELIELITAHAYARYKWYYIEKQKFQTKNYGIQEFDISFKYITRELISGQVQIIPGRQMYIMSKEQEELERDNIIHLNRNRRQFLDMLDDREACEFLHYLFTFPFLRTAVLNEFKRIKIFLADRFEEIVNQSE
ncbi:MAG: hypothetical protein JSV88_05430 [Candidatus Aminicenantes bacterium]|nr:MAG: hypothetical protein JSV88_05430 [Candidatus Aminicenantes bacterium]